MEHGEQKKRRQGRGDLMQRVVAPARPGRRWPGEARREDGGRCLDPIWIERCGRLRCSRGRSIYDLAVQIEWKWLWWLAGSEGRWEEAVGSREGVPERILWSGDGMGHLPRS